MNTLTSNLCRHSSGVWLIACAALLAACGSKSDSDGPAGGTGAGSAGTGGAGAAGASTVGAAGSTGASGASGATGMSGASGATGMSGAANAGAGGVAGSAGALNSAGSGGAASLTVDITPHPIPVGDAGKVFNVAEDFFDDGFVPPSPLANFGFHTPIIPLLRADGGIDVAWLDYTAGKGKPFGLPAIGMINVTHIDAGLTMGTTAATGIKSYALLGFSVDPSGNFYVAYNADSSFKTTTKDDPNNVTGNELRIAKSTGADFGTKAWDKLIFGDVDNTKDLSKGNAGAAGSGVLGYDVMNQKLVLYVAHQMAWGDNGTRHQAGFFAYIDPATGTAMTPGGGAPFNTGAGWFYSHDFDQRLFVDGGVAYVLGHGDAYPRQLGFAAWTPTSFSKNNDTTFDKSYFTIDGTEGDNDTNAETGQFLKLKDGSFALIHTSSQGRAARDVHIVLANGTTGATSSDAWLTMNAAHTEATMPKLEVLNDALFVSYGLWDSTDRTNKKIAWYWQLLDSSLKPATAAKAMPDVEFVAASPLVHFTTGPNAGSIGWVSGNASHTLSVNVVSAH